MNEAPSFPRPVPLKAQTALDPFSQLSLGKDLASAPAMSSALKDYVVDAAERSALSSISCASAAMIRRRWPRDRWRRS